MMDEGWIVEKSGGFHNIRNMLVIIILLSLVVITAFAQDANNPLTINGGSILAMAGRECVALAVDKRFASGFALVNVQPRPVLRMASAAPYVLVAFTGLEGDIQSLQEELVAQVSSLAHSRSLGFTGAEEDDFPSRRRASSLVSPRAMNSLTSHILYERRMSPYYVEPLVVGLELSEALPVLSTADTSENGESGIFARPFLCSQDIIGAKSFSKRFCCAGAACQSLYGTAEALWQPDLSAPQLLKVCGQAFLSALERDCLSGYGALIYLITKDGIVEYDLESRND